MPFSPTLPYVIFLTKDEYLRKPEKSELLKCIRVNTEDIGFIKSLPSQPSLTVIDFMSYARRYPVKTMKLKTFVDFAKIICKRFLILGENSFRIDVVFDL